MTWTTYRWDDVDAPTLSASSSSNLVALLEAVLVTGYSSGGTAKAAAGWSISNNTSSSAVFQNAGTGKSVKVTHAASTSYARVVGSEANDGIGPFFPTEVQMPGGGYIYLSSTTDGTARPWLIQADSKRFYMWIGAGATTAQGITTNSIYGQLFFFGDITPDRGDDAFHFMVVHGIGSTNSSSQGASMTNAAGSSINGHYLCRDISQTGGSKPCGKIGDNSIAQVAVIGTGGVPYPDPAGGGMRMTPVRVAESNSVIRGAMPGLWCPLHNIAAAASNPAPGDTFTGTGALAGKTFLLLNSYGNGGGTGRIALEISDTVA